MAPANRGAPVPPDLFRKPTESENPLTAGAEEAAWRARCSPRSDGKAISETEYTKREIAARGALVKQDATACASGTWMNLAKIAVLGPALCGASVLSAGPVYAQQPAQPQQQYPELPAGEGKDTLIRVCSKCHSPDNVIANGQDREGWENTITKMAGFGAAAPTMSLLRFWTIW